MMNYAINDKVIHSSHGSGHIADIMDAELVEGFKRYYVIHYPDKLMTVYIPVGKMEELGFRPAMQKRKQAEVLDTLRAQPNPLSENYKIRQANIRDMLKTGLPIDLAEVVRDLTWYQESKSLTIVDQKLLDQAREALVTEMAAVKNLTITDATELIETALEECVQLARQQPIAS